MFIKGWDNLNLIKTLGFYLLVRVKINNMPMCLIHKDNAEKRI